jgi:hypothetical protein
MHEGAQHLPSLAGVHHLSSYSFKLQVFHPINAYSLHASIIVEFDYGAFASVEGMNYDFASRPVVSPPTFLPTPVVPYPTACIHSGYPFLYCQLTCNR